MPVADGILYVIGGSKDEREALVALLGRLDRQIVSRDSGEAMLADLPEGRPLVLISAVKLPGMSGMDLLKELRRRGIAAPAILISDDSDISTAVDAIRAGASDFIERPIIDRILLRRVQSALEASEAA